MKKPLILCKLIAMEDSLKTEETKDWAYPTYAGEATEDINGHKVTVKVIGHGPAMDHYVNGKKVSFKKLCTILGI